MVADLAGAESVVVGGCAVFGVCDFGRGASSVCGGAGLRGARCSERYDGGDDWGRGGDGSEVGESEEGQGPLSRRGVTLGLTGVGECGSIMV